MATPALIPIHVDALPIDAPGPLAVPGQDPAKPFDDSEQLERGVHLHWALPDGLTQDQAEIPFALLKMARQSTGPPQCWPTPQALARLTYCKS